MPILLNLSSVISYIHPYKDFLKDILASKIPDLICITRFQRCEDSLKDAFAIQDVINDFGYCGSVTINLFGKNSLEDTMINLGYELLVERFDKLGNKNHFFECDDNSFKRITSLAYIFIRK